MKHLIQEIIEALGRQRELGLQGLDGDFSAIDRSWFFERSSAESGPISAADVHVPEQDVGAPNSVAELKAALDAKLSGKSVAKARVKQPTVQPGLRRPDKDANPLQLLRAHVAECTSCDLSRSRSQVVFGEGTYMSIFDASTFIDNKGFRIPINAPVDCGLPCPVCTDGPEWIP